MFRSSHEREPDFMLLRGRLPELESMYRVLEFMKRVLSEANLMGFG